MTLRAAILFLSLSALSPLNSVHAQSIEDALTLQAGSKTIKISLTQLKKKLPTVEVQIDDPVYNGIRKFDAFSLDEVLKLLGEASSTADEVVFQAADGYAPSVSRVKLEGHHPFLAYQEHARSDGERFQKVTQGKALLSPAPFYLIWKEGKSIGEEYPWPYQLVKIELVRFKEKYAKIFPTQVKPDSSEIRGFTIFKNQCIRCHSVNLVGGDIGPELNTPKNVLEYWNEKTLRAFIKNPSSFRAKDKMPPFSHLSEQDIDGVFSYFRYLQKHRN
jgi:mono/diheme cytochrome c family protein